MLRFVPLLLVWVGTAAAAALDDFSVLAGLTSWDWNPPCPTETQRMMGTNEQCAQACLDASFVCDAFKMGGSGGGGDWCYMFTSPWASTCPSAEANLLSCPGGNCSNRFWTRNGT